MTGLLKVVRYNHADGTPDSCMTQPKAAPSKAERLHELLMDLVRATGLLQPDHAVPGQQLTVSQAFALHELDTEPPLSQRDLAERLHLEKSTVSRLVSEMERKGLVVRAPDPANRRTVRLRLTDEGRALHAGMAVSFHEQYVRWVSALEPAECDALLTGLAALVRTVRQVPARRAAPGSTDR
jgi:DNA-binding MarR family transcriptional regulator